MRDWEKLKSWDLLEWSVPAELTTLLMHSFQSSLPVSLWLYLSPSLTIYETWLLQVIFRNITVKCTPLFLCILTRVSKASTSSSLGLMRVYAQSLQSCPTLCHPMDCSPPGSFAHGDSPGKYTEVGCYAILQGIFPTWAWIQVCLSIGGFFTIWATREAPKDE